MYKDKQFDKTILKKYNNTTPQKKSVKLKKTWFDKDDDVVCFWLPKISGVDHMAIFWSFFPLKSLFENSIKVHFFILSDQVKMIDFITKFINENFPKEIHNIRLTPITISSLDEKGYVINHSQKGKHLKRKNYYSSFNLWLASESKYDFTCLSHSDVIFGEEFYKNFNNFKNEKNNVMLRISNSFIDPKYRKKISKKWKIDETEFHNRHFHTQVSFMDKEFRERYTSFIEENKNLIKKTAKYMTWPEQELLKLFSIKTEQTESNTLNQKGMYYLGYSKRFLKNKPYNFIHIDSKHYNNFVPGTKFKSHNKSNLNTEIVKEVKFLYDWFISD